MNSHTPHPGNAQDIFAMVQERGPHSAQPIRNFLQDIGRRPISHATEQRQVHDLLLFILGYAADELEYQLAREAWERFNQQLRKLPARQKKEMMNSGYAHSVIEGAFSFELTRWFFEHFPGNTSASASVSKYEAGELMMLFYPGILKNEMTNAPVEGIHAILHEFHGKQPGALYLLLKELHNAAWPGALKEKIFSLLGIYLRFELKDTANPVSYRNLFPDKHYYHASGIEKKIQFQEVIGASRFHEITQSKQEKKELSTYARLVLLSLFRETDPITYCNDKETRFYSAGRGMSIAFFFATPDYRLTTESYVGYMAFKNGIPLAYGGAWICGGNGRIGVNIFPWFRGGESAWIFTQLIACYHKNLGVQQFSVEPYQIGLDNPDGIASGAFWFYYKLGFRPKQEALAKIAEEEWRCITAQKGHRSSSALLKQLAHSILHIQLGSKPADAVDSVVIRKLVADHVREKYRGDYRSATADAARKAALALGIKTIAATKPEFRKLFEEFALLLVRFPNLETWPDDDKKLLAKMISEKALGNESESIRLWQQNRSFQKALKRLLQ